MSFAEQSFYYVGGLNLALSQFTGKDTAIAEGNLHEASELLKPLVDNAAGAMKELIPVLHKRGEVSLTAKQFEAVILLVNHVEANISWLAEMSDKFCAKIEDFSNDQL